MSRLENKIAVVTGANSGISLATAKAFLDEGAARVYITGRRKAELDAAVASLGERAVAVQSDVTRPEDLDRLYDRVKPLKYYNIWYSWVDSNHRPPDPQSGALTN